MSGDEWSAMRSKISPAFTVSKLRGMFDFVTKTTHKFTQSLVLRSQQDGRIRCDMKDLFVRYTVDVSSLCIFGVEINSFENPTNEFLVHGKRAVDFSGLKTGLRISLLACFPWLMHAFDFEFVPQRIRTFFKSALLDTMNERTKKQIFRPDVVNALMEIRNKNIKNGGAGDINRKWTDDELAAQGFFCFITAFDTAATISAFMAYELALNQQIQQKLYNEIRAVNESLDGGRLTFDALSKLKYLDQVINETLRKWPPASFTTRKCSAAIELDLGDGKKVFIERGIGIWTPIE